MKVPSEPQSVVSLRYYFISAPHKGHLHLAQRLALVAFTEDLRLIPSTHKVAHKLLEFQFQGIQCPLLPSEGVRHYCGAHKYIHTKHTYT